MILSVVFTHRIQWIWSSISVWPQFLALWRENLSHPLSSQTFSSVQFSHSVVSDSLRPHELQDARPPCPSPTPRVHSESHPSSQWYHPAISSYVVPFFSCPQSLPAEVFSNESTLHIRWPKYWSFSFSIIPSKEHPGLISFRMDWLDLLAVKGTQLPQLKRSSSATTRDVGASETRDEQTHST